MEREEIINYFIENMGEELSLNQEDFKKFMETYIENKKELA